jgi:hypothetical protein
MDTDFKVKDIESQFYRSHFIVSIQLGKKQMKSVAFRPQVNYTD